MSRRSRAAAGALALVVLLAAPAAPAGAHATLSGVSPQRGAVLRAAPAAVVFRFSEPVTGTAGAVRVYGPRGQRVDDGAAFHPGGRSSSYGVRLRAGLGRGTYTATYQVISADGHVVGAGSTFSIGAPSTTSSSVSELLQRQKAGPVTRTALTVARGVQFAAIAVGVGVLVFLLLLWPRALARVEDRGRGLGRRSDGLHRAAHALSCSGAPSSVRSARPWPSLSTLRAPPVRRSPGRSPAARSRTRSAPVSGRSGVWRRSSGSCSAPERRCCCARAPVGRPRRAAFALLVPAAYLVLVPGLGGHAGAVSPTWILVPANAVHVAAASVWAGGIAALLFAVRPATRAARAGRPHAAARRGRRLLLGRRARGGPCARVLRRPAGDRAARERERPARHGLRPARARQVAAAHGARRARGAPAPAQPARACARRRRTTRRRRPPAACCATSCAPRARC